MDIRKPRKRGQGGFMRKGIGLGIDLGPIPPSAIAKLEEEEKKKERDKISALVRRKNRRKCEDCLFYSNNHCGLYSSACVNSMSKPRFLPR